MANPSALPLPEHNIQGALDEWYYNGQVAKLHQNAQYDVDGNLLFFIIDGYVYNKNGYTIADPKWLYQNDSWEDNVGCDVCIQANSADVIISPVPNQCNLYYIIFTEVHPDNSPGLQAHYMILDTEGANPFFPNQPEIRGRLLHTLDASTGVNTLAEFPNFDQTIFDNTAYGDRGILFYESASVSIQPFNFMELHDFNGNENKHLYSSYQNKVWRHDVQEDKILLKYIYSYDCQGIVTEYDFNDVAILQNNDLNAVWPGNVGLDFPASQMGDPVTNGGDLQIHYVENLGKNLMVFNYVDIGLEGGVGDASWLFFTTLNDDGTPDDYLGCLPYLVSQIYGFNFSENGNYFYINYGTDDGSQGGIHCWELFLETPVFTDLPGIDQDDYFDFGYNESRIEENLYLDENALYTMGNSEVGVIDNLNDPTLAEFWELNISNNTDLTGYLYWWTGESSELPYIFRFLNKQNYKVNGDMVDNFFEPECCVPYIDTTGIGDMTFTADETWTYGNNPFGNTTEPVIIKGTLTFETGSKIDIENMELMFGPNSKIMIEPGARLIVDGATLTSACNVFWRGIFVVGNTNQYQSYSKQGYLITKNEAIISNATFAVRNYGLTASGGIDPNKSGGIIRASDTKFENNKTDVRMRTFKKYYTSGSPRSDLSYFRKCNFITDNNMFEESDILHVNLYDVNRVAFSGCLFEDSRSGLESFEKSIGISSNQAAFSIRNYVSTPITFNNLHYAIKAWNYSEATIKIENAIFNSYKGVYFNGIDHAEILGNTFNIEMFIDETDSDKSYPYGLYLDNCADYKVNTNDFNGIDNFYQEANLGIVVHNAHGINTDIRDNEFINLTVGAEAIGQNKGWFFPTDGLQILCNTNVSNENDIVVFKWSKDIVNGIALNQGQAGDLTTDPAGNLFTASTNFKNYWNNVDHINYFHHDPDSEPRVRPSTQGDISLFGSQEPYNPSLSCIIPTGGGGDDDEVSIKLSKMNEATGTISQIDAELNNLVDGGNTQQLENDVVLTTDQDAWIKYLQLMAEAGYLSEDVLAEVSKKESGFSKAMIRNILAANPQAAKSAEIQKNLDERINPLPDYMREQIDLGLTKISPKEYLEWMRGNEKRTYDYLLNEVLTTWMADTVSDHSTEIIDLLSNTNDISNDYRLVDFYDNNGQSMLGDMLLEVLNGYPLSNIQQEDYNNFTDFRNLTLQWRQSGINLEMLNNVQIANLNDFATMRYPVGSRAMALLNLNNALDYNEPLFVPEEGDKSYSGGKKLSSLQEDNLLVLFPNPSSQFFTVEYSLKESFNSGKLIILDVSGKIVQQTKINYSRDQILISTNNWPSGIYSCTLLIDGLTALTQQVTVIK